MWDNCFGIGKCAICQQNVKTYFKERQNCFVCGCVVCSECSQTRNSIPPPEGCPRYEANYEISKTKVPVCLKCIKNPEVLFIKDKPDNLIESVEKVFNLCVEAVILANRVFPVSSSNQFYNEDFNPNLHSTEEIKDKHFQFSQGVLDNIRSRHDKFLNSLQGVEEILSEALKLSIGNCKETSLFCFMYLFYAYRRREIFTTEFGLYEISSSDHVFLIISPLGNLLPKKEMFSAEKLAKNHSYRNVIICDPYKKSVFMAYKYTKYMSSSGFFAEDLIDTGYSFTNLARYPSKYRKIEDLWKHMHLEITEDNDIESD